MYINFKIFKVIMLVFRRAQCRARPVAELTARIDYVCWSCT